MLSLIQQNMRETVAWGGTARGRAFSAVHDMSTVAELRASSTHQMTSKNTVKVTAIGEPANMEISQ